MIRLTLRPFALPLTGIAMTTAPALADTALSDALKLYGDARVGYFSQHRNDRDGDHSDSDSWRLRLRAGLKGQWSDTWSGALRVAGRYADEEGNQSFAVDAHATSPSGLALGESTVDEAWLQYRIEHSSLKLGRFQTKFALDGVPVKSLDRDDSPNTDITWTDGMQWTQTLAGGWRSHLIVEYNDSEGPSNAKLEPLGFTDSNARWSGFASFENTELWGPVYHRALDITYLPEALYSRGLGVDNTEDYVALVARGMARWAHRGGGYFLVGVELGYAPNTPEEQVFRTGSDDDTGGTAYQVSFNLMDFRPGHSVGVVLGAAEAGWLLSPDFRPNGDLAEIRYAWKPTPKQKLEIRLRRREDIERLSNTDRERVDTDYYVRYTYAF